MSHSDLKYWNAATFGDEIRESRVVRTALSITEHGNVFGSWQAAKKELYEARATITLLKEDRLGMLSEWAEPIYSSFNRFSGNTDHTFLEPMTPTHRFGKFAKIAARISFIYHGIGKQLVWMKGFLKFNGENLEFSDFYKQHFNHLSIYRVYKKKISKKRDAYVFSIRMDAAHPEFEKTKLKRIQLDFGDHKDAYEHCIDEFNEIFEKFGSKFENQQKKPATRPNKAKKVHVAPGALPTSSEVPRHVAKQSRVRRAHFSPAMTSPKASRTSGSLVFDSLKPKKRATKKLAAKRSVTSPKPSEASKGSRVCIDSSSDETVSYELEEPLFSSMTSSETSSARKRVYIDTSTENSYTDSSKNLIPSKRAVRTRHSWTSNPAPLSSSRKYGPNSYRFGVSRTFYTPRTSLKVVEQTSSTCTASGEASPSLGAIGASFGDSGSSQAPSVYSGASRAVSPASSFGVASSKSLGSREDVYAAFGISPPPFPSSVASFGASGASGAQTEPSEVDEPVESKPIAGFEASDPPHENPLLMKTIKAEYDDIQMYAVPSRRSARLAEKKEKARLLKQMSPIKQMSPTKPRGSSKKRTFDIAKVKKELFEDNEEAPGPSRASKTTPKAKSRVKKTNFDLSLVKEEPEDVEPVTKRARISKSAAKKETCGVVDAAHFKAFEPPVVVKEEPIEDDYDSDDFQEEYEMMTEEELRSITWYDDLGNVLTRLPWEEDVKPAV